jgi:TetR/AcrR family transcriptional repressor of nem operon
MIPSVLKKSDVKRLQIIKTSSELILRKGFTGVGLQEILNTCGIPKGSFYHYFDSKEAFGCELVQHYVDDYQVRLDDVWNDPQSAKDKLIGYFKLWIDDPDIQCGWADTCLVVKLAAEVADLSDTMRSIMASGVDDLIKRIAALIEVGKKDQSIHTQTDALAVAQMIYQMWLGAALVSKLQKNKDALHQALQSTELILN